MKDSIGLCPNCREDDSHLAVVNYRATHFGVCRKCAVKWVIGANLFDSGKTRMNQSGNKTIIF